MIPHHFHGSTIKRCIGAMPQVNSIMSMSYRAKSHVFMIDGYCYPDIFRALAAIQPTPKPSDSPEGKALPMVSPRG
jgi:hypothetical protein